MPDFITLTCPTCGGKLKVTDQIHLLACAHCGNEHFVHRDGGAIYLAPLAQDVRHIRVGVDKTAAELAVARLTREVDSLDSELDAVMARTDEEWVGGTGQIKSLALFGGISLLILWNGGTSGNVVLSLLLVVFAVVGLGAALKLHINRMNMISNLRNAEVERINALLRTKLAQMTKNRRIAES